MTDVDRSGWRKSSHSKSGNCIEVASGIKVRDTKQRGAGPVLRFTPEAWRRFTDRLKILDTAVQRLLPSRHRESSA